jgi:amino acid adenylation domain-containing protein
MDGCSVQGKSPNPTFEEIRTWLRFRIANLLEIDPVEIHDDEPLANYGLGSVQAVTLSGDLEDWMGRSFAPTLAYEFPTIAAISSFLAESAQDEASEPNVSVESGSPGPIAIIGISCRLPGAENPDAFWKLLVNGEDAIRTTPPARWNVDALYDADPSVPGKMNTRWGGFIDRIDEFDAQFFGISPREAIVMDPQQRVLLELAWEALEDAGLSSEQIAGTRSGVFIGISTNDYAHRQLTDIESVDAYMGTGNSLSVAANRISYFLDLNGPSMAVDTACSSSLVAVHLACTSLWNGESELALAGGVNLILSPAITVNFTKAGVSSPDGRCKTFDAAANGYVRGEGAAIVVLKPLSSALRDGDRVYAVIRGTAISQDGRTNGLMAPNPRGQEAVLHEAYRRAGISAGVVDYVETHGTGTSIGDQIEAQALGSVLSIGRKPNETCIIGSVKSNIGHLEAAAGIAGLIKVVLSLQHRWIPPSLHFNTPNPNIAFQNLSLTVAQTGTTWPNGHGAAVAGVSSFGFGGTNAHVVLQESQDATRGTEGLQVLICPISARSPEALAIKAREWIAYLRSPESDAAGLQNIAYTAAVRRTHHDYRLACVAETKEEWIRCLEAFSNGEESPGLSSGRKLPWQQRRAVFVFSGQGSQWFGMARDLLAEHETFRASLEKCDQAIRAETGWSVIAELFREESLSSLGQIDILQPTLFAIQVALADLWQSWGVKPAAVVGHSMGEVAAAHVAGRLVLADAARIVCARSRILKRASGRGGMLAVELAPEDVAHFLERHPNRVAVAASNGPHSVVLAGETSALTAIMNELDSKNVFCRLVSVDVAAHSFQMDELRDDLVRELTGIAPRGAAIPFYSTVVGGLQSHLELDPSYWADNLRQPVLFWQAIQEVLGDGHDMFVEISPNPILTVPIQQSIARCGKDGLVVASLRRNEPALRSLSTSLAMLFTSGLSIDWKAVVPGGRVVRLPSYPWQRQRYWLESGSSIRPQATPYSSLGPGFKTAKGQRVWEIELNQRTEFLTDHRIQGVMVMPAAAYIQIALSAARQAFGDGARCLKDLEFRRALILPENEEVRLQAVLSLMGSKPARLEIYSNQTTSDDGWILHATAVVGSVEQNSSRSLPDFDAFKHSSTEVSGDDYYSRAADHGLEYGGHFRLIDRVWRGNGEAVAKISLPDSPEPFAFETAFLDASLQSTGGAFTSEIENRSLGPILPVRIRRINFYRAPTQPTLANPRLKLTSNGVSAVEADVAVFEEDGGLVAEVFGLELRSLSTQEERRTSDPNEWFYEIQWRSAGLEGAAESRRPGRWIIFSDGSSLAQSVETSLVATGDSCQIVHNSPTHPPSDITQAFQSEADPPCGVIYFWALKAPVSDPLAAQEFVCSGTLRLVQAMASAPGQAPQLWLITRGAQPVHEEHQLSVEQSPLWGLAKVIGQEHPEWRCSIVDLDPSASELEAQQLVTELKAPTDRYVAFRGNARYIPWFRRFKPGLPLSSTYRTFRLEAPPTGVLDDLVIRPAMQPKPLPGTVVIEVLAAGLNFLDVLKALAIAPNVTGPDPLLGAECAGRVVALGEGVTDFSVGDEVLAIAPSSFATFAVTSAALAVRKPSHLTWEEAATIPIAFVTAYYAFRYAGNLMKGERVLIHAASGGVGLAAIQIAQWIGAEVFATAGSPEKREFVRSLGVRSVMDSRTLSFAEEVMEETRGAGIDVVLNSLAGEAIPKGLSTLASFGRFVEIGKRDIYQDSNLSLLPFKRNLSFHAVDLARMCRERPAFVGGLLRDIVRLVDDGVLKPLRMEVFPLADAGSAFRQMAQAKHTGKIVLSAPVGRSHSLLKEDATYLITGGLGGLGLLVSEWMIHEGARHLVLVGRRAPSDPVCKKLESLREDGAEIVTISADVSDREQVAQLIQKLRNTMPPLRGIIHAAGILDDGILLQLTEERFHAVAAPKIGGAWNLHRSTLNHPLDFFVLFSSAASVLGSPGQANYAAANAFLDGLAHYRRNQGLPAMSINWGPWSEAGLAARADRGGRLGTYGFESISPGQGLDVLRSLLETPSSQVVVAPIDRNRWPAFNRDITLSELLTVVLPAGPTPEESTKKKPRTTETRATPLRIRETLRTVAPADRCRVLEDYLSEQVGRVLRLPAPKVDVHQSLRNLGIDSLMGVELKNRIESELGSVLPIRTYLEGPTILQLAAEILARLPVDTPSGVERQHPALPELIVEEGERYEAFALNEIQQAYWVGRGGFFEMGNVAAHVYGEVEGRGLDLERLSRAWQRLIERHEMLRAVVLPEGQQRILEQTPRYEIVLEDLEGVEESAARQKQEQIRGEMSHQVRATDQWPLFEIRASRRGGYTRLHISVDLLIADAWSILLLMREWEQLYGNPDQELPRLDVSFRDYVQTEMKLEGTALRAESGEYWRRRVETLAGAPELPLAKSPAGIEQPRFVRRSGRLEREAWRLLKKQGQQAGVTPSMLLCTAFSEVLGNWSKTQRFTLNVTMFNRLPLHEQVNQIVGDFTSVNLLEVERRAGSFQKQAERVQQQLWEDLEHRYWSGLQVIRELHRIKGDGAMASMPVVFTSALAQGPGSGSGTVVGWLGRLVYGISQTPQVWLDHQVYEDDGALVYNWDAVEELFPSGVLEAMFQAYGELLDRLKSEAEWQNERRNLAPAKQCEQRAVINASEESGVPQRLETLFDDQVSRRADRDAVVAGTRRLSYRQLQQRANRIAHWLGQRGATRNRLVGVVMEKGWEQVVAVLGVLKATAAYLPIDAAVPAERLQYLLGHGEVELVLTQSWLEQRLAWPANIQRLAVDQAEPTEEEAQPAAGSMTDLAYVIYTSGSTGQPKGVMIDHQAAVNTIVEMNRRFGVNAEDRVLAVSSLSFDLSVYDIFGVLGCGGTIVLPDAAAGPDPAHWVEQMTRHGVTLWNSVPALMELLVDYVEAHPGQRPAALKQVWLSGDWIPLTLPERIGRLWDPVEIISLGGATEAAIWSIYYRIGPIEANWKSIPYGKPLANQRWEVLNEIGEPCPVWVTGHLYIGGQGLAQGYWRDATKTAASFLTDRRTGERLYRTGDMGRYLPDGNIEFLGREDFQVKIQGHRIELGEIEAALDQHPEVRSSVVTALGESQGSKRLVAYVVCSGERMPEPALLRRHLEAKLPDYMIPTLFIPLPSLPLSPNGKLDRRALPLPERPVLETPPRTAIDSTTRKVGDLIASVLGVPNVDAKADLRDLGMNSMDMMRIANLLEKSFGFRPRIGDLFRFTTAAALADAIDEHIRSSSVSESLSTIQLLIDPEERERFKTKRPGLRLLSEQETLVPLPGSDEAWTARSGRRSHRQFSSEIIPVEDFSLLMSLLREVDINGQSRRLYGSAGALYAVQTYVHIKSGRIEGMGAGLYYYHPIDHGLLLLAPDAEIPNTIHESFVNRPIFEQAAFSVFLVGRLGVIARMYGEQSSRFAAIEAGLMTELLETSSEACRIGLCQIGTIDFDKIRGLFGLDDADELIHSLVGGRVDLASDHEEGEF